MALYSLVYRSTASEPFDDAALEALLRNSRRNNAEKQITGILLYGFGFFVQMLEGNDEEVRHLYYQKIRLDPRHKNLKVLREGPISQRLFTQWAMAFRPYDPKRFLNELGFVDPDKSSAYGRNLLSPLQTMQALELLAMDVRQRGE